MAAKEISVSGEERERLETLIREGKSPSVILLKADPDHQGSGTSVSMGLPSAKATGGGFEAVLSRKQRARQRYADFRWREGSQADCLDPRAGPCGCWRTRCLQFPAQ